MQLPREMQLYRFIAFNYRSTLLRLSPVQNYKHKTCFQTRKLLVICNFRKKYTSCLYIDMYVFSNDKDIKSG